MTVYIEKGITYKLNKCDAVTIFDFIHVYFCEVTDSNTNHFGSISDSLGRLAALLVLVTQLCYYATQIIPLSI